MHPQGGLAVSELWKFGANELAAMIASKQVSSREVVDAHLARIEEVNPRLNAVVRVLADEARRCERKRSPELCQVHQHVVRRAPGAFGLAADVGEPLALRIHVDHLDLVDNPIAAGEHTAAVGTGFRFHGHGLMSPLGFE